MYYLYNKKGKSDDQCASISGRTASSAPIVGDLGRRHLHPPPHSILEEEQGSSSSLDVPEGLDSSARTGRSSRQSGLPVPASEEIESKQEKKDDQVVRRLLRRRGLQEHDFTEEVMQPRRPNRISCQRCHHDIATNDSQHRIMCTDRERHVFCKCCVVDYVEVWVDGTACYELRKQGGTARGLHDLRCMSPSCHKGCLLETSMQPLLAPALFMSFRQKLAKVRTELSRSKSRGGGGNSPPSGIEPFADRPPHRRSVPRQESPPKDHPSSIPQQLQRQQQNSQQLQQYRQQQDHMFQQQRQELFIENERQLHHSQQVYPYYDHYLIQQQQMEQRYQHMQQPNQYHQQQHEQLRQSLPLPLPAALRRSSSASTASQKTQKTSKSTSKSVRFSLAGDEDNLSNGSSASSLTTRFPVSIDDDHRKTEKEEANRRYRQLQLREQLKLQHEEQGNDTKSQHRSASQQHQHEQQIGEPQHQGVKSSNLATCQCCYEEISTQASNIVCCAQRHPGIESHSFCAKCVRMYVEEWVYGAATYQVRPGPQDPQGETSLVLPCLHGDCADGGFADESVCNALSNRSMEQYLSKINPMRIQKQDDEERLVQMAIRLSLEQEEIQRRVARLHEEQRSVTRGDGMVQQTLGGGLPPAAVSVPQTTLSTTSSLTSFNTLIHSYPRSLPDLGTTKRGTLDMRKLTTKLDESSKSSAEDQHSKNCEKSVHEVEEAMTQAKIRTCPNCRTKFLKDEDFCNKLKCPSCKTAICYICRKVIPTQGYEHFCIHKQGGCGDCLGHFCPLWTQVDDDNQRDMAEMRARGLDEANRIWEESLLQQTEIRVDVDSLLQQPSAS